MGRELRECGLVVLARCVRVCRVWVTMAFVVAGAVACGGGGGGGGATSGGTTAQTPSASTPLVLTDTNGGTAAYLAASYGELVIALGELQAQWIGAWQDSGSPTRSRACSNGGTETLTFEDRDSSGGVTPGDRLQVRLQNCYSRWVDSPITGSAQFQWGARTDATHYVGTTTFGDDFLLVSADATLTISGPLALQFAGGNGVTDMRVSAVDEASLAVVWRGGGTLIASAPNVGRRTALAVNRPFATADSYRDTLRGLSASKRVDLTTARATTQLQFQMASEMLGGQLNVSTPTPLVAELGAFPQSGNLWATGANNARVEVKNSVTAGPTYVDILLDLQGDGRPEFSGMDQWAGVSIGVFGAVADRAADEAASGLFVTRRPTEPGIGYVISRPATYAAHNTVGALTWQFSEPIVLEEGTQLVLTQVATNGRAHPWGFLDTSVPVTVSHNGARIQVTPSQVLEPGSTYRLANYALANRAPRISIGGGSMESWDYTLTVADALQSDISFSQPGVVSTALSARLQAHHVYAGTSALNVQWRQISGPPVVLSSTAGDDVTVSLPASGGSNGDAVLELQSQTTDGDVDRVRIKLPVVGNPLNATQALFNLPSGFEASTPGSTFLTSHRGDFASSARVSYGTVNGTVMQLTFFSTDDVLSLPYRSGVILIGIPSGDFAPGMTYSTFGTNPTITAFVSSWSDISSCSPDTGSVTVHEIVTGAEGAILRLALDFERNPCTGAQAQRGSIRINSARPLLWP